MASEIKHHYSATGSTLYCVLYKIDGTTWNVVDGAWETYDGSNWADYDLAMTEDTNLYLYTATIPTGFTKGRFVLRIFDRTGTGAAAAISDPLVYEEEKWWDGSNVSSHGELPPGKVKSYP